MTLPLMCWYTIQIALVSQLAPSVEVYLLLPFPPSHYNKNIQRQIGCMQN